MARIIERKSFEARGGSVFSFKFANILATSDIERRGGVLRIWFWDSVTLN